MPSKKKTPVVQITDGTWYAVGTFDRDICCGCGLVHDTEYKLENGRLFFRTTVNTRATRQERRAHGIQVIRKDAG